MADRYLNLLFSFLLKSYQFLMLEITPVKLKKGKVKFDRHEFNMNCFKLRLV